ncbi:SBBP repeat-containing protein [Nannocystis radixulma]|uniref:SBBP repeat-containing protein n=1 Tax=Nannocystis radixulma TaxID=2995305 RepID=A0ABT5AZ26_9BACT|nr:SBBP repeat-containing protein [Nannocystis radixulma]MDC0667097.1 SBBP repeat-containing protein [Nannocystis radixulma]
MQKLPPFAFLFASLAACSGSPGETTANDPTAGTETAGTTAASETGSTTPTTTQATEGTETTVSPTTAGDTTTVDTSTGPDTDTGASEDCAPDDTRACYSGPDGTEGVGQCVAGEQQCGPDGTWGSCIGEVVPAPESCDLAGDEDCDGADPCMGEGTVGWSRIFGGPTEDYGAGVAFDGAGNVVVAATSTLSIDFGGGPLIGAGIYPAYDVYVAKFSPTGAHLWSKRFGDADVQGFRLAITTTAAGEIVMAGDARGTIDFGGGPLVNGPNPDGFLVKFTGDGEHVWSKAIKGGNFGNSSAPHLAVDEGGNIVLAGSFRSDIDLGGGVMVAAGETDVFLAKFSSAGAHQWSRRFGDPQQQDANGVGVDGAANIYVTGGFRGAIDPGSGPLISAGESDMFVAKFDPAGQAVWGARFGGAGAELADGLVVDSKDRITITGVTNQSIDFGGGPIVTPDYASVLAQFDSSGAHQWSRLLCTTGLGRAIGIATDGFDSVLLAGSFSGQCDLGGGPLTAADATDTLVARLTPSGAHVWSKRFGEVNHQAAYAVAGSAAGVVAATGGFLGLVDFGDGPETGPGLEDGFIVTFSP